MKAALYYPWIYLKSGAERTIAALVAHSRHDWTLYTNRYERDATFPELRAARIVEMPQVSVRRSVHHVADAAWRIARQRLPLQDERALLVVCEGLGDFITLRNRSIPAACLCLTPLRAAFDPHYQAGYLSTHRHALARRVVLAGLAAAFRVADRVAWRRYGCALAISEEVEARIRRGRLRPGRGDVEVVRPGVDTRALEPLWEYEPYFLLPGRIMWTKNLQLGIRAFQIMITRHPELSRMRLVIAGFVDEKSGPYLAELQRMAADVAGISFVVSPSDQELFALYRSAYAVVCTAFNEDWGLVPLEAMALGKPVVAVDRGGLRETVKHGDTGLLVPPEPEAFAESLAALASAPDRVRSLGRAGHAHAQAHDVRTFVRQVDDRVEQLAQTPHERPSEARHTNEPSRVASGRRV